MALLHIQNLHFAWPAQPALLDIPEFTLARAEKIFLSGPSGSGKSSLLALLAGVLLPQHGDIVLQGKSLSALRPAQRDAWRAAHLGFVFQQFNLLPYLSVRDNVLLPLRFSPTRRQRLQANPEQEAQRLLGELQLPAALWSARADSLSIGQQQRVAVARALIGRPELLIADEPTSALDADTQQAFLDLLFRECEANQAGLLFVSHDQRLSAHFDRVLSLRDINRAGSPV